MLEAITQTITGQQVKGALPQEALIKTIIEGFTGKKGILEISEEVYKMLPKDIQDKVLGGEVRGFVENVFAAMGNGGEKKPLKFQMTKSLAGDETERFAEAKLDLTLNQDVLTGEGQATLWQKMIGEQTKLKILDGNLQAKISPAQINLDAKACLAKVETVFAGDVQANISAGCVGGKVGLQRVALDTGSTPTGKTDQASALSSAKKSRLNAVCAEVTKDFSVGDTCKIKASAEVCAGTAGGGYSLEPDRVGVFLANGKLGGGVDVRLICD